MLEKIKAVRNDAVVMEHVKAIAGATVVVATVCAVAVVSHKIKQAHKSTEN